MTSTSFNTTLLGDTFSLHTCQETQMYWWIKLKYYRQQKIHHYIRCFLDGRCGGGDEAVWQKQYGKTDCKITGHGALCTCICGGKEKSSANDENYQFRGLQTSCNWLSSMLNYTAWIGGMLGEFAVGGQSDLSRRSLWALPRCRVCFVSVAVTWRQGWTPHSQVQFKD